MFREGWFSRTEAPLAPARRLRFCRRRLVPIVLLVGLWPFAASGVRAEDFSQDFIRAIRQFVSTSPRQRVEGEKALRKLADRVLPQLKLWIERTETHLARARKLLKSIDPESTPATDDRAGEHVRDFFVEKLDEGWKLLLEGDYETASRIASGLETLDGDPHRIFDYRRLRRACENRMVAREILEPSVAFRERVYEVGEKPVILFRLANHQTRQLVIRAARGLLGTLEITIHRSFVGGSYLRKIVTVPVRTRADVERLVLPAGGSYEQDILVELDEPLPRTGMVMRLSAIGRFRPSQWGVGERNVNVTLELPRSECWVVPRGERNLALSPLKKLEVALFFRDLHTFFTAGQLAVWLAEEDEELKKRLGRLLIGSLEDLDTVGFQVADRLLKQISDVPRKRVVDRAFWKKWLADQQAPPPTDREEEPPFSSRDR